MIIFDNVSKSYHTRGGEKRILDRQSFTIQRGQSLGICGRNGAGKSTLTRLISGIEHPNSGKVTRQLSVSWPLGFGGAFQNSLTGADNTRFIARIYGQPLDDVLAFVEDFAELGQYLRMPVKTYSSGMQARLAFAISLAVNFECYLVDEITAVGDARFRERCRIALEERRRQGTLVMISHDPHTLREHCDSGALLRDGRLIFYPSIDETIAAYEASLS